jgi:peptide/nickel transport system permease protein
MSRLPQTIELTITAMLIAIPIAISIGVVSAVKSNSLIDHFSRVIGLLGVSIPTYWLGIVLQIAFAITLGLVPVSGSINPIHKLNKITGFYVLDSIISGNLPALISRLEHLILPALSLAAFSLAWIARMTRASMLNVMTKDYVRTAKAKGLPERVVIVRHVLRNALVPTVTVIGLQFAMLLGGAVLVEHVFSWPGIGSLVYNGIMKRDLPLVQGCVLVFAVVYVAINLLVDVSYAYLDPRITYD